MGLAQSYTHRPLAQTLLNSKSKVVIMEGARAVGKTLLARREIEPLGFSYQSLAENDAYAMALSDPSRWVRSLKLPAIIDEAQRVKSLSLAVKEVADATASNGPLFILTGSASIDRTKLDGQDPLARRAQRFELSPLTKREIERIDYCIVDDLWSLEPNPQYRGSVSSEDLKEQIEIGGFPRYALDLPLISKRERSLMMRADIESVLGDTILPEEKFDKAIAQSILQTLLANPGNILNVSNITKKLSYHPATINRYISMFEKRFLMYSLRNLNLAPQKQTFTRAKLYPQDASFSVEAFRQAGKNVSPHSNEFGGILEAYVVNQIIPSVQWSTILPQCFFWRETGNSPKEVDLVLVSDDELIGVEVKASSRIRPDDFKGLKALAKSDQRFKKGFVVYCGETWQPGPERMWGMPITALWDRDAFLRTATGKPFATLAAMPPRYSDPRGAAAGAADAQLVLSYNRSDNNHLNGAIVTLARNIAEEYDYMFGAKLNVHAEEDSIDWEAEWESVLDSPLDTVDIIMPAITPRYLASESCRAELIKMSTRQQNSIDSPSIIPLVWQSARQLADDSDPIAALLAQHPSIPVDELQFLSPADADYRRKVRHIVERIREIIENAGPGEIQEANGNPATSAEQQGDPSTNDDFLESLSEATRLLPHFQDKITTLGESMKSLTSNLPPAPSSPANSPSDLIAWCERADEATRGDLTRIHEQLEDLNKDWGVLYACLRRYTKLAIALPDGPQRDETLSSLESTLYLLKSSFAGMRAVNDQVALLSAIASFSRRLAPLSEGLQAIAQFANDIDAMLSSLADSVRAARR